MEVSTNWWFRWRQRLGGPPSWVWSDATVTWRLTRSRSGHLINSILLAFKNKWSVYKNSFFHTNNQGLHRLFLKKAWIGLSRKTWPNWLFPCISEVSKRKQKEIESLAARPDKGEVLDLGEVSDGRRGVMEEEEAPGGHFLNDAFWWLWVPDSSSSFNVITSGVFEGSPLSPAS